ncbi:MAG: phosphoribosylanthranilate isomerase [Gammaproteobacteria bacterium]|nr:MAG: phosphoribosylanthranilate isomerase [Gammaproteobacteria bacterium]
MLRKRIKVCGIKKLEDAMVAAHSGADALGFVFYEPSPRNIDIQTAKDIIQKLPAFVTSVALFVDPDVELVETVIEQTQVDLLQFHGNETAEFCTRFSRPYIKALRVRPELDIAEQAKRHPNAKAILLDAYVENVPGGTGKAFNWSLIPAELDQPVILAGGLHPGNVAAAIEQPNIWGVDVSGGVEAQKGVKSPQLIKSFCRGVNGG